VLRIPGKLSKWLDAAAAAAAAEADRIMVNSACVEDMSIIGNLSLSKPRGLELLPKLRSAAAAAGFKNRVSKPKLELGDVR